MQISLILFPVAVDQIVAVALDIDATDHVWERHYTSVEEVVEGLCETGIASVDETSDLEGRLKAEDRCPVFRAWVEPGDLEDEGFVPVRPETIH